MFNADQVGCENGMLMQSLTITALCQSSRRKSQIFFVQFCQYSPFLQSSQCHNFQLLALTGM